MNKIEQVAAIGHGITMSYPMSSVEDLYRMTKKHYDDTYNKYVKRFYDAIMESVETGYYDATLCVGDYYGDSMDPVQAVTDALEYIRPVLILNCRF